MNERMGWMDGWTDDQCDGITHSNLADSLVWSIAVCLVTYRNLSLASKLRNFILCAI